MAALALRTGAPVVPVFALPLGGGRYRMIYEHPVEPPRADSRGRRPRVHAAVHGRARDVRAPPSRALAVDAPALARRRAPLAKACRGCSRRRTERRRREICGLRTCDRRSGICRRASTVHRPASPAIGIRQPVPNARSVTFRPGAACLRLNSATRTSRSTRATVVARRSRRRRSRRPADAARCGAAGCRRARRRAAANPDRSGSAAAPPTAPWSGSAPE